MRLLSRLMFCALLSLPGIVRADVVVELFTSQGCSSCPPADAFFNELAKRDDVVALSYHVDYWDYLGWKDTFAQSAFTARQRAYAHATDRSWLRQSLRGPFTPEIVVQGTDSVVGSNRATVIDRIGAHAKAPRRASVKLSRKGGNLIIALAPSGTGLPKLNVLVASILPEKTVAVGGGENAGRTITYANIVTQLRAVGVWDGAGPATLSVEVPDGPAAVVLQEGKNGPILAAASLR